MARNYPHIKNEELRDLIKMYCDATNIRIKFLYKKNKAELYDIIEQYGIMDWIVKHKPALLPSPRVRVIVRVLNLANLLNSRGDIISPIGLICRIFQEIIFM